MKFKLRVSSVRTPKNDQVQVELISALTEEAVKTPQGVQQRGKVATIINIRHNNLAELGLTPGKEVTVTIEPVK